jgi:hypothetical protein
MPFSAKKSASESLPTHFFSKRRRWQFRQRQFLLGIGDFSAVAVLEEKSGLTFTVRCSLKNCIFAAHFEKRNYDER